MLSPLKAFLTFLLVQFGPIGLDMKIVAVYFPMKSIFCFALLRHASRIAGKIMRGAGLLEIYRT